MAATAAAAATVAVVAATGSSEMRKRAYVIRVLLFLCGSVGIWETWRLCHSSMDWRRGIEKMAAIRAVAASKEAAPLVEADRTEMPVNRTSAADHTRNSIGEGGGGFDEHMDAKYCVVSACNLTIGLQQRPCSGTGGQWRAVAPADADAGLMRVDLPHGGPRTAPKQILGEEWNHLKSQQDTAEALGAVEWVLHAPPQPPQVANNRTVAQAPCMYNRAMTVQQARCQLQALPRIAFVGDSLLRNFYENFATVRVLEAFSHHSPSMFVCYSLILFGAHISGCSCGFPRGLL